VTCHEIRSLIPLYVDHELPAPGMLDVEAHLLECPACHAEYEGLLSVVNAVRGVRPLYDPPPQSAADAAALMTAHGRREQFSKLLAGAAALLICVTALTLLLRRPSEAAQFEAFAADTHLRYARGLLPLDAVSTDPEQINNWLAGHLRFHLSVPDYPLEPPDGKRYSLTGVRLVQFREDDVAFLAYQMNDRPISLLVAPSSHAAPSGGEVYRSGNLAFHFSAQKGLNLITWTDRGLTYAIVSDLAAGGASSCVVCHGRADERDKLRLESISPGYVP
jgi:anti-sigma factor RsiW